MKSVIGLVSLLALLVTSVFGADLVNAEKQSNLALQGYDPVAFFTDAKPMKGSSSFTTTYHGYAYRFASEEHRMEFQNNPEKYLPAFGGFCAFGVSKGKLVPVEIDTWEIVDGRLILQNSQAVKKKFSEDKESNLRKADANWPQLADGGGK